MSTMLNEQALDGGLTRVEAARAWSPRLVSRLEGMIRSGRDADLFRVNPLAFAGEHAVEPGEAVDLFVHATAAGLFRPDWVLICPNCACAVTSLARLGPIEPAYHCPVCHQDTEAVLDEFIAVYFTVAPRVRSIVLHRPLELSARDYLFTARGVREGRLPDGTVYLDFIGRVLRAVAYLEPAKTTELVLDAQPGRLQAFSVDADAGFALHVNGERAAESSRLEIRFLGDRTDIGAASVGAGPLTLAVRNDTDTRPLFGVIHLPMDFIDPHLTFDPFLTGQQLLMTQSFRDLFRPDVAGRAEGIAIRSVAVVFTDLQGSTALYRDVGDLNALQIVQEHFGLLREVVAGHGGCVVKTIGDAVMAAFRGPAEAVRAALGMMEALGDHPERARRPLVLKAGIHCGAALAVTLNDQLDYFGQTVNLAARVQAAAEPGEIVLSETVWEAVAPSGVLDDLDAVPELASIRGSRQPIAIRRVRFAAR